MVKHPFVNILHKLLLPQFSTNFSSVYVIR